MPIKWSALNLSEAMDRVERQVSLADVFLVQALMEAREARKIVNLPGYLDKRLARLIVEVERIKGIRAAIEAVRGDIPKDALETEQAKARMGDQQSLI